MRAALTDHTWIEPRFLVDGVNDGTNMMWLEADAVRGLQIHIRAGQPKRDGTGKSCALQWSIRSNC
jgi:hypothetical protein